MFFFYMDIVYLKRSGEELLVSLPTAEDVAHYPKQHSKSTVGEVGHLHFLLEE